MTRARSILWCFLALTPCARAQYQVEWANNFESPGATQHEEIQSCAVAGDGSVFVTSWAYLPGGAVDAHVACYSSAGALLSNTLLGEASSISFGTTRVAADANGFAYTLWTGGPNLANQKAQLVKTNAVGHVLWRREVDGVPSLPEFTLDLELDSGGNCLALSRYGNTPSALTKFDAGGAMSWSTTVAPSVLSIARDLALTPDDGAVVVGAGSVVNGPSSVVALDSSGSQIFATLPTLVLTSWLSRVAVDRSGAIAVCGYGAAQGVVAMLDASGAVSWSRLFSPGLGSTTKFNDVAFASDGTLWAAGLTQIAPNAWAANLVHYDRAGNSLGRATWPSWSGEPVLSPGTAGDMRVAGMRLSPSVPTFAEAVIQHFDATGQRLWGWNPAASYIERALHLTTGPNDRVVVTGRIVTSHYVGRVVQFDASEMPRGYCVAETNSLGCQPNLIFTGLPRASDASGFTISVSNVLNQKTGLLFYGTNGATNVPFHSGTLCVQQPLLRTPIVSTGGSSGSTNDCSGAIALDMSAFASGALGGNPSPALTAPGARVWAQAWSRDPGSTSATNLSSALTYVVLP